MGIQPHGEKGREEGANEYSPLSEHDSRWQSRKIALPQLDSSERGDQQSKTEKASPDFGVGPRVGDTAPLESKKEADNGADEEESTKEVNLADFLFQRQIVVLPFGVLEEKEHGGNGNGADWKIDVEAPSP